MNEPRIPQFFSDI